MLKAEEVLRLQDLVRGVPIADAVMNYAVRLVAATRPGESKAIEGIHKYLLYGASPRASQYLVLGAKARAILAGKYHVDFDDVKAWPARCCGTAWCSISTPAPTAWTPTR